MAVSINNIDDTMTLSGNIGTENDTRLAVNYSKEMSNSALEASRTISESISTLSNGQNRGEGVSASQIYLKNLSSALTTLSSNLDKTEEATVEIDNFNTLIKDLSFKYLEKEKLEAELEVQNDLLATTPPTITKWVKSKKVEVENDEYLAIEREIQRLEEVISALIIEIDNLKQEITSIYDSIKLKYRNLSNFSNLMFVSDNSFSYILDNGVIDDNLIKEFMIDNNLEYYEYNNVVYNVPSPYSPYSKKPVVLEEKYLIKYDLNKIGSLVNFGNPYAEEVVAFLRGKANGTVASDQRNYFFGKNGSYFHHFYDEKEKKWVNRSISGKVVDEAAMADIMDYVLEDTYKANNCSTMTDYAVVSMLTASAGIFNGKYSNCTNHMTEGISGIVHSSDCIGAINWAVFQGLSRTEGNLATAQMDVPLTYGIYNNYSEDIVFTGRKVEEILPVGTIVSSKDHVAMVIGHTVIDGVERNVVAQTGDAEIGYNVNPSTKGSFTKKVTVEDLITKWKNDPDVVKMIEENTKISEDNM